MHFGQKDTEDESDRITFFLQSGPLQENTLSFFTFPPSSSFISFSSDSTLESEEEDEDEADAAAASSPTPSPLSFNAFVDDDADAGIEVTRVVDEAVGMGGGKSSSSPPAFFAVIVDFADDDDILMVSFSTITKAQTSEWLQITTSDVPSDPGERVGACAMGFLIRVTPFWGSLILWNCNFLTQAASVNAFAWYIPLLFNWY